MKGSATNAEVEVVWGVLVDDACVGKGGHEQNRTAKGEGADKVAKHDGRRFDADLDIIPAILASVDRVCAVSARLFRPHERKTITVVHGPAPCANHEGSVELHVHLVGDRDPGNDDTKVHGNAEPCLWPVGDALHEGIDDEATCASFS